MRLAWLGNFDPPESTENHWRYAFEQHGVDFVPIQQDRTSAREWEAIASEADAASISTTWGWPMPASKIGWERLQRRGVRTFSMHLDLVMGIPREREILASRRHPQFFGPEFVWSPDGHHEDEWVALGVNHIWLPPAIHAPNAVRGISRTEHECDVVFVGSCAGYHPEWPRRKALVAAARERWGSRFRCVGGDWGNTVRGPELADVYASAKVALGDSLCPDRADARYFSDRLPETAGRGGVLVHPKNLASEFFEHTACWSHWEIDEQLDAVDAVLGWSDDQRETVRTDYHLTTVGAHTYTHRALDALSTLGFA